MLYNPLLRNVIFALTPNDAERAHRFTLDQLMRLGMIPALLDLLSLRYVVRDQRLEQNLLGLTFPNPTGVAAGMDKDGECVEAWQALGFGFVTVGTVTPHPQIGNDRPRLFRIPEARAIVNRMGFNNKGAVEVAANLTAVRERGRVTIPIGVSVGKQKETDVEDQHAVVRDYVNVIRAFKGLVDSFEVNVSSPNTVGLRRLLSPEPLHFLLSEAVEAAAGTPVFLKESPDESDEAFSEQIKTSIKAGVKGAAVSNTTTAVPPELNGLRFADEKGGKSGPFLKERMLDRVWLARQITGSRPFVVKAVGGIQKPLDGAQAIAAGADIHESYTGIVYEGPSFARNMNAEYVRVLSEQWFDHLDDLRLVYDLPSHF